MLFLCFVVNFSLAATFIKPVTYFDSYSNLCGGSSQCCECTKQATCASQDETVKCSCNSGTGKQGTSCLLSSSEYADVQKQNSSGADESLITSFNVLQVYDLLSSDYSLTYKQLYAIYTLGKTLASTSVQQNEMEWYLRSVEKMTKKLNNVTSLENSAKQNFQIEILDLVRLLMFKYIDLDTKKKPYFFETKYYSGIIANWKDTIDYSTMTINDKTLQSAKCEYKSNSVLIRYKLILAVSNDMVNTFINSTFTYNSTVTYCQFMDKTGTIYYRPSSEFHYWHYIPNYDYEPLKNNTEVIGLGCFQIQLSNSVYGLVYDDQECQYKEITTTRTQPYCQCNEPGLTFVQVLWSETKMQEIATLVISSSANTTTTESYSSIIILINLILLLFY